MAGVTLDIDLQGLPEASRAVGRLAAFDLEELATDIGAILESGARRRIMEDKRGPDDEAWLPWSEAYDDTRDHDRHSLLVEDGDLHDSVQSYTTGTEVRVGSNLVYAAIHQLGGDTDQGHPPIPARPYLGVSAEDGEDIRDLVVGRLADEVRP